MSFKKYKKNKLGYFSDRLTGKKCFDRYESQAGL